MRFESTGTVVTSSGLSVTNPIIIVDMRVRGTMLSARISAYVSVEEEENDGREITLRKDGSRDLLDTVSVDLSALYSDSIAESITDIIRRNAKNYIETNVALSLV